MVTRTPTSNGFASRVSATQLLLAMIMGFLFTSYAVAQTRDPLSELIDCHTQVQDFYWKHQLWPKENPGPKPKRSEVLSDEAIKQQVLDAVAKEQLLAARYQIEIDAVMLQADLNRMARDSKDPNKLRALFHALGNDPNRIADCVSRPMIVQHRLINAFNWDQSIHSQAYKQTQKYLDQASINAQKVYQIDVIYALSAQSRLTDEAQDQLQEQVQISTADLATMKQQLSRNQNMLKDRSNQSIKQTEYSHYFEQAIDIQAEQITTRQTHVLKQSFEQWWQSNRLSLGFDTSLIKRSSAMKLPDFIDNPFIEPRGNNDNEFWVRNELPIARVNHTAIWTGTEMIIWGGRERFGLTLNTGSRYNPIQDTWQRIPIVGAPKARKDHHAFWTGSEMVIWGGNTGTPVEAGGKFNPNTNSWAALSTINAPQPSGNHSAIWTGDSIIVWGSSSGKYDYINDVWEPISSLSQPVVRSRNSVIWTGSEMIIWGGNNGGTYFQNGGIYNPVNDTWRDLTSVGAPNARNLHAAAWTGDQMLIIGGYNTNVSSLDAAAYNPKTDSWSPLSTLDMPELIDRDNSTWMDTTFFVWPGDDNPGALYNPMTDTWSAISAAGDPTRRVEMTTLWTGTEVIVWGGRRNLTMLGDGGRYHPITGLWSSTNGSNYLSQRLGPVSEWTGNELIVWGGRNSIPRSGGRYNPSTDWWRLTPNITDNSMGQYRSTSIWTGTEMIIWGGSEVDDAGGERNAGRRLDGLTNTWSIVSTTDAPSARGDHTAIWTGEQMIIWGGDGPGSVGELHVGGKYTPITDSWTPTNTIGAPSLREYHSAVWTGDEMVIWGGHFGISGGRYLPLSDSWLNISTNNTTDSAYPSAVWTGNSILYWVEAPNVGKQYHPASDTWFDLTSINEPMDMGNANRAIWTGTEMIVWGGLNTNAGGRYDPMQDSWNPTTTVDAPEPKLRIVAEWTGTSMVIWGGINHFDYLNFYYPDIAQYDQIFADDFEN